MSTINKSLSGFMYNGTALALASAAFKGNLNTIYGFNSAGTGYTSFKPTSTFNSLTQLAQDGVYIVDAKTPGFDIPGAVFTAVSSAATPTLTISDVSFVTLGASPYMDLKCRITSSNSADTTADVFAAYPIGNGSQGPATFTRVTLGQVATLRFIEFQNEGITSGDNINLLAIAPSGAVGRASIELS